MDKQKLNRVSRKAELQATVTTTPNKDIIAAWYNLESRAMRDRYIKHSVCIKHIEMTQTDYGEIFFKCGKPTKHPAEVDGWIDVCIAVYCRSLP